MLEKLFGSNARVKILKLFLLNPHKKHYIRQIARDLKLQVNSVRRELDNLEDFGLLISNTGTVNEDDSREDEEEEIKKLVEGKIVTKKAKTRTSSDKQEKKYYQVNKDFPLYEEIKALILRSKILYKDEFVEKLKKAGSPKLLILSGFFVGDTDSPIDILAAGVINKAKFSRLVKGLEKEFGRELNFALMTNSELKYRREMTDVFLYSILERDKIIVIDEVGIGG